MSDKPKKTPEELRAQLLATPETKNIAKTLGMTLEAYVELVLDYALHPEKKPQLNVIPDAEAKAGGAATTEEVKAWFEEQMKSPVSHDKDTFEDVPKKR